MWWLDIFNPMKWFYTTKSEPEQEVEDETLDITDIEEELEGAE